MESIKNRRDIKLVTTEGRRNHLVSIISNRNEKNKDTDKKTQIYLGLSILEMSKSVMYEFWYDYVKPKSGQKK